MKDAINALLMKLQEQSVLSAEDANNIRNDFQQKLVEYRENIISENADGVDEKYAKQLESLLESIDLDSTKKLEKIISIYESKIDSIDEDVTRKTQTLLNKIDEDHSAKLENLIDKLDEDVTEKTQTLIEKVKSAAATDTNEELVENVNSFLETYLEEKVPQDQLVDMAKLNRLEEAQKEMKNILCVNDDYIQEEVKEAILDGKAKLDEKDRQINELMEAKMNLKKSINENKSAELLESKLKHLDAKTASYLKARFEGASVEEITESFNSAKSAFAQTEAKRLDEARKENQSVIKPSRNVRQPLHENTNQTQQPDVMDMYSNMINKGYNKFK